jgi:hypothetical protein
MGDFDPQSISIGNPGDLEKLCEDGINADFKEWLTTIYLPEVNRMDIFRKGCELLRKSGTNVTEIESLIDSSMHPEDAQTDVMEFPEEWRAIGIKPEDYIETFARLCGDVYLFDDNFFDKIPPFCGANNLLKYADIDEINQSAWSGFDHFSEFLDDYVQHGVDINMLADRYRDGLSISNTDDLDIIVAFVGAGIDMGVDRDELIEAIKDGPYYINDDKAYYLDLIKA